MAARDTARAQWLSCLSELPLAGAEASVKFSAHGVSSERYLAAYERSSLSWEALQQLCSKMQLPASSLAPHEESFREANQVGFGYEAEDSRVVYKLYFEFWDRLVREIRGNPQNVTPRPLHIGLKWDPVSSDKVALARYTCFPLLSIAGINDRLSTFPAPDCVSIRATRKMIEQLAPRLHRDSFVYLEAGEEGTSRRSYDVNFYKANCRVHEALDVLDTARGEYGLPAKAIRTLDVAAQQLLGHIGGGQGRNGSDYLTVYFEIDQLPQ